MSSATRSRSCYQKGTRSKSDLVEVQSEACSGGVDEVDGACDVVKEGEGFLRLGLEAKRKKRN